jgi:hypothetical protein
MARYGAMRHHHLPPADLLMPLQKKYVMANTKRRSIVSSKKGGAKQ